MRKGTKHLQASKLKDRLAHIGKHHSVKTEFTKGGTPWNKGLKNVMSGEVNGMWKGEKVGYNALHRWVQRRMGKASYCSFDLSHKSTKFEWANISGSYLRDDNDYVQLCCTCHRQYDSIRNGYRKSRRINI